jgi:hypothetical protein
MLSAWIEGGDTHDGDDGLVTFWSELCLTEANSKKREAKLVRGE